MVSVKRVTSTRRARFASGSVACAAATMGTRSAVQTITEVSGSAM
jgi:hypothetical protein